MTPAFTIDPNDGAARIEGHSLVLAKGLAKAKVAAELAGLCRSNLDYKNGYEWLMFDGVSFGGLPAALRICFLHGRLTEIHFDVTLPTEKVEDGWPTQETIDGEIAFMCGELKNQLGRPFASGEERFPWGVAWSVFDPKAIQASAGLRYQ